MLISDHLSFNTIIHVGFFDLTNFRELRKKYRSFLFVFGANETLEFAFEVY